MSERSNESDTWQGIRSSTRDRLENRDYSRPGREVQLASSGLSAGEAMAYREELSGVWIPGVEIFSRTVYQQLGRGYFAELARTSEGVLATIGLNPKQWASALMHRDSAKGFHIHAPHVPAGRTPSEWFRQLYLEDPENYALRPYDEEQWDVMFFLSGVCEMLLVDEREGMERKVMRITIDGDDRPGANNAAVVIPAGVAHALRSVGREEVIMVYGTSTVFNPEWEGRLGAGVEECSLPDEWISYLSR